MFDHVANISEFRIAFQTTIVGEGSMLTQIRESDEKNQFPAIFHGHNLTAEATSRHAPIPNKFICLYQH